MPIRLPAICDYHQTRSPLEKGLLEGDYLTWTFIPLRRVVPIRGALSCAFGAALLQGPTRGGLSHTRFSCRCDELCLFEALHPAPLARPFSKGLHAGIISHRLSCRCDELCLFEALHPAPLARPFSKGLLAGVISHRLSCRCGELCLFEALYPTPLARPFSKGLLAGIISHRLSCRCDELCLFEALYPAPLARPFSKGLLAGDYLTWAFMPLRRVVPLRSTLSRALVRLSLPPYRHPKRSRGIFVAILFLTNSADPFA